jgi:TM2 domain-containing membrane protein YozV
MGNGSCGNVIAALASFFIPGLGQLLQGRWLLAGFMFVLTGLLWLILLGWVIHLWSIIDAAVYRRPDPWRREDFYRSRYDYRRI